MTNRRRFLLTGSAALAMCGCETMRDTGGTATANDRTAIAHRDAFLPWLEVSASALRHNVTEITRHAQVPLCACVKAGGYGLGEVNVARAIDDMRQVWGYMVVRPEEAFTLAAANLRKKILLLAPVDEDTAIEATRLDIQLAVTGSDSGAKFARVARGAGRTVPVHIDVDTGINRQGVRHAQYVDRLRDLVASKAVGIEGVASYFAVSAGETVGYGEKNRIAADTNLGLLMIGSLDGYDHRLTKGTVVINGKPRRVLTRTGSHCVVDLERDAEAQVGDVAALIGAGHPDIAANEGGAAWANYYLRQDIPKILVA